jgi:hypothetical protein
VVLVVLAMAMVVVVSVVPVAVEVVWVEGGACVVVLGHAPHEAGQCNRTTVLTSDSTHSDAASPQPRSSWPT